MGTAEITSGPGRAGLRRVVDAPARALLATDFDGTIAPIVADPAEAYAQHGAVEVLSRLAAHLGGVAVVTGRPVAEVLRLGALDDVDGLRRLRVLGQYGVETWDAASGRLAAPRPDPGVDRVRAALPELLARLDLADAHVEDKQHALGVHLRRTSEPDAAYERLRAPLSTLAGEHGLVVEPGKQVLEVRAGGTDKGTAVAALIDDLGVDTVVYAGDDLGDLAAFDAVEALRAAGGAGILVGVTTGPPSGDPTGLAARADLLLDGPASLLSWLSALADSLEAAAAGDRS